MLDEITPVVLTYNEAPNIERTLSALTWARRVVVMDSFSDDQTQAVCARFQNVDFIQRHFDQHAKQWNAALEQDIATEWVLALDADHILSAQVIDELRTLTPSAEVAAFEAAFVYKINGQALRSSLYPPVLSLYRHHGAHYIQDGHTQRVVVDGLVSKLHQKIYHDDRKSWARWCQSQRNYAKQEAKKRATMRFSDMALSDKMRHLWISPLLAMPYTLLVKGVIRDGWLGIVYAWERVVAEWFVQVARVKKD